MQSLIERLIRWRPRFWWKPAIAHFVAEYRVEVTSRIVSDSFVGNVYNDVGDKDGYFICKFAYQFEGSFFVFTKKSRKSIEYSNNSKQRFVRINPLDNEEYYDGFVVDESVFVPVQSENHAELTKMWKHIEDVDK